MPLFNLFKVHCVVRVLFLEELVSLNACRVFYELLGSGAFYVVLILV